MLISNLVNRPGIVPRARPHGSTVPITLREFDKSSSVVHRRWRKDAVPEIQDVANWSGLDENLRCSCRDPMRRTKQQAWIEIALKCHAPANPPARFRHRDPPIHAYDVGARVRHRFQNGGASV